MIKSLTGLRIYAALLVFITHFLMFDYFFDVPKGSYFSFFEGLGALGVSLFFILSGFILYINYLAPGKPKLNAKLFYWARFSRIYPVFFVALLCAAPIQLFSNDTRPFFSLFLPNLFLVQCWRPEICGIINPPDWSISNEAFFYAVFPLLGILFQAKNRLFFWTFLLLYGGYLFWNFTFGGYWQGNIWPLNRLIEFLAGMIAGSLYCKIPKPQWLYLWFTAPVKRHALTVLVFGMISLMASIPLFSELPLSIAKLCLIITGTLFILLLAYSESFSSPWKGLTHPWVIYGGEISYSFYLVHQLVIRYFRHGLFYGFGVDASTFPLWFHGIIFWLLLLMALGISHLMFQHIETPCRRYLRNLVSTTKF